MPRWWTWAWWRLAFTLGYLPILCIFITTGWGPDPKQAWPIIQIWIPCTILLIIVWSYPREKEFDLKEESRPNVPMNEHEVQIGRASCRERVFGYV